VRAKNRSKAALGQTLGTRRRFWVLKLNLEMTSVGPLADCGKSEFSCHLERSEGSAFSQLPGKKQIPRANPALGMTVLEFFPQPPRGSPSTRGPAPAEPPIYCSVAEYRVKSTTCMRSPAPTRRMMPWMWFLIVCSERFRRIAISLFVNP
jgi:hypothetical protein